MKKLSALALIAFLTVGGTCVRAQDSLAQHSLALDEPSENQFEFLRNLRQKGYAAQANEYIDLLLPKADKTMASLLKLEKARNSVALAKEGKSLEEKTKLLAEAKAYFEPFVKTGEKTAAAAQARTELAKLLSIQAQMTLNKALAADGAAAKQAGAKAARALYDAADAEFKLSVDVLGELAKSSKQYEAELIQAEFDRANNLIDKAQAFVNLADSAELGTRSLTVDAARKIFEPIAKHKDTAQGLLANAYLVKAQQELQDPTKVFDYLKIVYESKEKFAEPAQRLAGYFDIAWMPSSPDAKQKFKGDLYKKQVEFCDDWLKSYPAYRRSYYGEAVRFEQAQACLTVSAQLSDGLKVDKILKFDKKARAEFDGYFNKAKRISDELEKEKGDFAERGGSLHGYILDLELSINPRLPDTADTLVRRASKEFQEAVKADADPKRQKHLRTGLGLLEKAIARGYDEKLPPSKLHEYEFIQGSVYYGINDFHRAAISFEAVARSLPPSKKGAEAAEQAIQIYKTLADKENDKGARERLHDLADYVFKQKVWEAEPVQGFARYDLAMDYKAEDNLAEALKQFELLPKEFPGYTYAQGQAMYFALMGEEAEDSPEGKKKWVEAAKKALARMGPLPAEANGTTSLMWFSAACKGPAFRYTDATLHLNDQKLKEAEQIREAEKDYLGMKANVLEVAAAFAKYGDKLAPDKKTLIDFEIKVLDKYWRLGLAKVEYRRGNYAKVVNNDLLGATLGDLVKEYQKDPSKSIKVKDVVVMVESVNLGLRAFVQQGQMDAAKGMYEIMLKIDSEKGGTSKTALTRALIKDLADQVKGLKDRKEDAKLKDMVTKFSGFVDDLAKQLVYDVKAPENGDIKNLAKFYGSLGLYKKGADLFKKVSTPTKLLDAKDTSKLPKDKEDELLRYWDMQLEYGRLLRESKEFKEANKVFVHLLNHPNARYQLFAEEEQNSIYEDMESYGNAIKGWKNYMEGLQRSPNFSTDEKAKKFYFEGYYRNVLCYYKLSQLPKYAAKEDQYVTYAANQIIRLETSQSHEGWTLIGPKFQVFMEKEKKLRDKYNALKK